MHRLSLKVLELGERGGERWEERDFVAILAGFTGVFLTVPALNTVEKESGVWYQTPQTVSQDLCMKVHIHLPHDR